MSLSSSGDDGMRDPAQQPPPMLQFTIQGGVRMDGSTRPDIEVAVVSLARYTFADPVAAMNGPTLLEPPAERSRILPPTLGSREAEYSSAAIGYDDDGLIADFTEDRCNSQLAQIARRLLLPDSYVEACFDLHQFLALRVAVLETESVQRNAFKCLKICARLSKLPGYSIQLMWQVIQQAQQLVDLFTAERAHTINLWLTKLTNRIRLMAVTPASDGSAPPRLPLVPPPELLHARTREKLLPLPSMSVAALNDGAFNRVAGVSGASHYLANPLAAASRLVSAGTTASPPRASAERGDLEALSAPIAEEEPGAFSTREAELAIIEHQLRELEGVPAHRMGPMLRAALNLLVEMRFRLQLGLPRHALISEDSGAADSGSELSATPNSSLSLSANVAGDLISGSGGGNAEMRIIDYVLDQISTSRRMQAQARVAAGGSSGSSFGIPLFMIPPQSHSGDSYYTDTSDYSYDRPRSQVARLAAPGHPRESDVRRRRRSETGSGSGSESLSDEEDDSASGDLENIDDESDDQQRRRRNRLRRRILEI
ncbi:hypothetical protein GGI00_000727 [Coemansia sp. RSA 2681]|nr:hypothetical protein GGI00_000727 [Coemansia sp. RSA 2681]